MKNLIYDLCNIWARFSLRKQRYLFKRLPPSALKLNYPDLLFLYQAVRKRKPKIVLEFGSGCSTRILAQALKDNNSGFLYSLESDAYWHGMVLRYMPEHLQKFYKVIYAPVCESIYEGVRVFRHANIPDIVPNFVYLDGPELTPEVRVCVDPLEMENIYPADFYMVVDGRVENVDFFQKYLKRKYNISKRKLFGNTVFALKD